jgi:hypothetical protein
MGGGAMTATAGPACAGLAVTVLALITSLSSANAAPPAKWIRKKYKNTCNPLRSFFIL